MNILFRIVFGAVSGWKSVITKETIPMVYIKLPGLLLCFFYSLMVSIGRITPVAKVKIIGH